MHLPFHLLNPLMLGLVVAYDASIASRQIFVNPILDLCFVGKSVIAIIAVNPQAGAEGRLALVKIGGKGCSARFQIVNFFVLDSDIAILDMTAKDRAEPVDFGW